jgi:hypothetical protein
MEKEEKKFDGMKKSFLSLLKLNFHGKSRAHSRRAGERILFARFSR